MKYQKGGGRILRTDRNWFHTEGFSRVQVFKLEERVCKVVPKEIFSSPKLQKLR